jgi:hypothetical protein
MDEIAGPPATAVPPYYRWTHTDRETSARVTIVSSDVIAGATIIRFAPTGGVDDPHRVHLSPSHTRSLVDTMTGGSGGPAHAAEAIAAQLRSPATTDFLLDHGWGADSYYASHRRHDYYHCCALCTADVPAILEALAQRIVTSGAGIV